jgi:HAD superfamily hydrolase (TIGR01484 family)
LERLGKIYPTEENSAMIFYVLACDYDGTLALNGKVDKDTMNALERVKRSGRKLMMVTGRELPDLRNTCEYLDLFDAIVVENGALLYIPRDREERLLCEPANPELVKELERRGVARLSVGRGIIATWEEYKEAALDAIQATGLEYAVIFNKGAVMLLPTNVNKGTGLDAGLRELGYSRHNTVGCGDAENDHISLWSRSRNGKCFAGIKRSRRYCYQSSSRRRRSGVYRQLSAFRLHRSHTDFSQA